MSIRCHDGGDHFTTNPHGSTGMAKQEPLTLPTTFSYTPEVRVVATGDQLEVGPSDLVFFQGMTPPGGPKSTATFVVLRRTNP